MSVTTTTTRPPMPYPDAADRPPPIVPPAPPRRRRRTWWTVLGVLLFAVAAGAATYVVSELVTPVYEASAKVRVTVAAGTGSSVDSVLASNDLASQYAQLVDSPPVKARARALLEGRHRTLGSISAGTVAEQNIVQITAEGGSPKESQDRANAVATAFTRYIKQTNGRHADATEKLVLARLGPLDEAIANARAQIGGAAGTQGAISAQTNLDNLVLERQRVLSDLATASAASQPAVDVWAPAGRGTKSEPRPILYAVVAFLVGGLLAWQVLTLIRRRRTSA